MKDIKEAVKDTENHILEGMNDLSDKQNANAEQIAESLESKYEEMKI